MESYTFVGGNITVDVTKLPQTSIDAMLRRGFQHYFGNEQSSKVTTFKEKFETENKRAPTQDEVDAKRKEFYATAVTALQSGTVGQRANGMPKVTPFEKILYRLAFNEVAGILEKSNIKVPKGEETVVVQGKPWTIDELVERHLEKNSEKFDKAAQAEVKKLERERAAKAKAREEAANTGSLADLVG